PVKWFADGNCGREHDMTHVVLVVEDVKDWNAYYPASHLMTAREYLNGSTQFPSGRVQVITLSRSFRYRSPGYYCSLLAEARGHRVLPSVRTVNDLSRKALYGLHLEALDSSLVKAMKKHSEEKDRFSIKLYFGQTEHHGIQELAREIFDQLPAPILQLEF